MDGLKRFVVIAISVAGINGCEWCSAHLFLYIDKDATVFLSSCRCWGGLTSKNVSLVGVRCFIPPDSQGYDCSCKSEPHETNSIVLSPSPKTIDSYEESEKPITVLCPLGRNEMACCKTGLTWRRHELGFSETTQWKCLKLQIMRLLGYAKSMSMKGNSPLVDQCPSRLRSQPFCPFCSSTRFVGTIFP